MKDKLPITVTLTSAIVALLGACGMAAVPGSGDGNVWVTDNLNITITGSGDVIYRGKPAISQITTGSGEITRLAKR